MTKAPFNPTTTYAVAPTRSFVANTFQQSTRLARVLQGLLVSVKLAPTTTSRRTSEQP